MKLKNNNSYSPIDVQNVFKYVNFIIQENSAKNNWKIIDIKTYKSVIFDLLNLSLIIGRKFTSFAPKKIQKLFDQFSNKKFNLLKNEFLKKNKNLSDSQLNLLCEKSLNNLKDYLRIVTMVWNQGEGRMFAKLDETYYQNAFKKLCLF